MRSAQCPAPLCKPSSTGSRDGASRTSAVAIRAAAPNHRRNATRLAPRACRLLRRGRGRPQSQKPSRSESASARQGPVPRGAKGASWLPRVGTLLGGLEAMWSQTSRQKVRDRAQRLLFERHEEYFLDTSVPLLYRPKDTRWQNIMVTIAGPLLDGRRDQQELDVPLKYAREVLDGKWGQDWALGYALTVHSSQGLMQSHGWSISASSSG